jgi:hypothetical protein
MLETLLKTGFAYHASESERLARELETATDDARAAPASWPEFLRLCAHTIGEHLGDWPRAARLGDAVLSGQAPNAETAKAWAHLSIVRALAGDPAGAAAAELAWLAAGERDTAAAALELKFMLVAALVGCGRAAEAASVYAGALALARRVGDVTPARAIAVASNNLGSELVEAPSRTAEEDALMRLAAEAAHEFWLKCGTWEQDERSRYLLALTANALGEPERSLAQTDAALAIIAAHAPRPVDEAFLRLAAANAHAKLGHAEASAAELAASDAIAAGWEDPGLITWHAEERARAFPSLPPRGSAAVA